MEDHMKRITSIFLFTFLILVLFVTSCYAGIWGDIKSGAIDQIAYAVVAGLFFILTIFLGVKVKKWKKVAQEGVDVALAFHAAIQPDSPGGKKIIREEFKNILQKGGKFGVSVMAAIGIKQME